MKIVKINDFYINTNYIRSFYLDGEHDFLLITSKSISRIKANEHPATYKIPYELVLFLNGDDFYLDLKDIK